MNTYQRRLINQLITELTATATPSLYAAQILAAELKGAMQAQDAPQKPTPDADGWVAHTSGKRPYGEIAEVKFRWGNIDIDYPSYDWVIKGLGSDITHYKPA